MGRALYRKRTVLAGAPGFAEKKQRRFSGAASGGLYMLGSKNPGIRTHVNLVVQDDSGNRFCGYRPDALRRARQSHGIMGL